MQEDNFVQKFVQCHTMENVVNHKTGSVLHGLGRRQVRLLDFLTQMPARARQHLRRGYTDGVFVEFQKVHP
jgi:hypothetical protein